MSKLILTNEVSGLGSAGDVIEVKNGYARNYLIPQGLAVTWSRGGEKQVDQIRAARRSRELATLEEAQQRKAALEESPIGVTRKVGTGGRLFGSVTTTDVAAAVEAAGLGEIDKRTVEIPATIRAVGSYEATVRLREDVVAVLNLQVVAAR